jgi:hypothetical protein
LDKPLSSNEKTVEVSRVEYDMLVLDAGAWRLLNESPHVAELLDEWIQWAYRKDFRDTSSAISSGADWRKIADVPTYAELERRRAAYDQEPLTPRQIRAQTSASWARFEQQIRGRRAA